ncbi:hypothetical protein GCM10009535_40250 [Streptomyces thermocarboxydovorans]|uniref:Uncharacterized protein n=1 Tax=Streptomyces thermocarboxydovorans TaxID=59298 RepID=A0ABN1HL00_9ACTN
MTTPRRRARAAAAAPPPAGPVSLDWRALEYGIKRWPPGPDNPVPLHVVWLARRRAREARRRAEVEGALYGGSGGGSGV